MKDFSRSDREKIVREEMRALSDQGLIDEEEFIHIMDAYKKHQNYQLQKTEKKERLIQKDIAPNMNQKKTITKSEKQPKEKPAKVVKGKEEVRERNIIWLLILGVIFLLISGLVVATSTWAQMGPLLKVLVLSCVSVFFLALSGISSKFLKIDKTAFAFLTLGSLLIPIAIVAIGYFSLFGDYLSLRGEGRFLLGAMGTLIPLPLYVRNAWKHRSRLFVWISYLFLTFSVGFLIGFTPVSVDVFYLLIMVFNALLLYLYHHYRRAPKVTLFVKELPKYAQLNLIVSTLLMLVIFEQSLFYSFNILLTATIYIAMVFVYNTKEYQFVFSALFAYGAYQLTESSWLGSIDLIVYGLIGVFYLVFAQIVKSDVFISHMFRYTSAVISFFAFIYISYQGIVIRTNEDSLILLAAYLVITFTYTYLSYITNRVIFSWLATIFLYTFGLQLGDILLDYLIGIRMDLFLFFYAMLLFILIGIGDRIVFLLPIKRSVFYLSVAAMVASMMYATLFGPLIQASLMYTLFGLSALFVVSSKNNIEREIAKWTNGVSWLFALYCLNPKIGELISGYTVYLDLPFHIAISSLILLFVSLIWRRYKKTGLAKAAFYIGQGSYLFGLSSLVGLSTIDTTFIRPVLLLVGIGVFIWLVRQTKLDALWFLVAITTFCFYASLLSTFSIQDFDSIVIFLLFGPLVLLVVEGWQGKRLPALKPYFFWIAQVIQLNVMLVILIDQAFSQMINPLFLFVPLGVYIYSMLMKKKEWTIKLFLYAALTLVTFILITTVPYYNLFENVSQGYYWFWSSILFFVGWFVVNKTWKERMEWYIIPFSNYGLYTILSVYEVNSLGGVLSVLSYVLLNVYFLHRRKWFVGLVIPLTLSLGIWEQQRYLYQDTQLFLISLASFFILFIAGKILFKSLYQWNEESRYIDWYSIVAVFYLGYSFTFLQTFNSVWIQIIPYVLLTIWLFAQVRRFQYHIAQKAIVTLGLVSFLPTYYSIIEEYLSFISELFHTEFRVLPVLVLAIILSLKTWKNYKNIMSPIQSLSLLLVTVILVMDAISSNTIWDALIVGVLSLLSLVIGAQFQIKSYFFIGFGTLLFNVIYQTKPYWGNMPWWAYLLLAGFLLIGIASYNEWQKQRKEEGRLVKKVKKLVSKFKEWN
ncbi:SCO7613 C-terminal domain-containing membrane protein [Paraliobacillus sp. X-1268]|uniref:SCO7613 C-terminal domain-containing membrane protein n=1 Tax=Paraliobacillus sp. X-1268 TaxID=2213193 RepID=UPI000E3D1AE2|nr:hypothetical protein [Paraliobacillus sp. X-1268]